MHPPFERFDPITMHNPIKPGEGQLAVKAAPAIEYGKISSESLEAS